jgi:hypothetical protein
MCQFHPEAQALELASVQAWLLVLESAWASNQAKVSA